MTTASPLRIIALTPWLTLASCGTHVQAADPTRDPSREPIEACLATLRTELPQHPELRAESFDALTRDLVDLRPTITAATESQPEFKLAVWDYIARLVDTRRIEAGRAVLAAQAAPLEVVAARHGVDAATVVAVFGVETDYGNVAGRYRVVDATIGRACLDLKNTERKRHAFAALWLLQEGLVAPDSFRGSWAGAFGLTQFMPGTFVTYRDALEGAAKVDIVGSPADALATTANFIKGSGWAPGLPWGVEVEAPKALAREQAAAEREHGCVSNVDAATKCKTVAQWIAAGVVRVPAPGASTRVEPAVSTRVAPADSTRVEPVAATQTATDVAPDPMTDVASATAPGTSDAASGAPSTPPALDLPPDTRAALLAPSGEDGPVWLVTRNFQALWQYNRADAYALAIGLLSNALRGEPPTRTPWPTDDIGLSREETRELQQMLIRRGHSEVVADGLDGPLTRQAIRAEEARLGRPETGRAGMKIAKALREIEAASPAASDEGEGR